MSGDLSNIVDSLQLLESVSGVWHNNQIPLKNSMNASTRLSMNGKSPMISTAPPFVLRLSKDERRVFQQNHNHYNLRSGRERGILNIGSEARLWG